MSLLPTRNEFLNSGLVPHAGGEDCMICRELATDPVSLSGCSCRVGIYCRVCITGWLERSPTCCTCRVQLFEDDADAEGWANWVASVSDPGDPQSVLAAEAARDQARDFLQGYY